MTPEEARAQFKKHLEKAGLRVTEQRLAIFSAAVGRTDHFTAEELLDFAREIDRSVSRATVYRTLPILTESGLLREVDVGKNIKFYTAGSDAAPMAQVICDDCGKIFEISAPFLGWYGESVCSKVGLQPVSQRLQVRASCPEWRAQASCRHRA